MKMWNEITHYAGFDWAKDHHDIVIVDRQGAIVAEFQIKHSQDGWKAFREKIKAYPALALAIETSQGAAIDQLLQCDCTVYPLNPLRRQTVSRAQKPQRQQDGPGRRLGLCRRAACRRAWVDGS